MRLRTLPLPAQALKTPLFTCFQVHRNSGLEDLITLCDIIASQVGKVANIYIRYNIESTSSPLSDIASLDESKVTTF